LSPLPSLIHSSEPEPEPEPELTTCRRRYLVAFAAPCLTSGLPYLTSPHLTSLFFLFPSLSTSFNRLSIRAPYLITALRIIPPPRLSFSSSPRPIPSRPALHSSTLLIPQGPARRSATQRSSAVLPAPSGLQVPTLCPASPPSPCSFARRPPRRRLSCPPSTDPWALVKRPTPPSIAVPAGYLPYLGTYLR
jgi:hypothetical protein